MPKVPDRKPSLGLVPYELKTKMGTVSPMIRPATTDEKVLREVLMQRTYRKASIGFDVEAGEHWLDLGANIGAFGIYCHLRGATATCYEPEPVCFSILTENLKGTKSRGVNAAVTSLREETLELWSSSNLANFSRGTVIPQNMRKRKNSDIIKNVYIGDLTEKFDGIKMDIEGSEFGILDGGLLPNCSKVCLEYHTSRDTSTKRLKRRLNYLRSLFTTVVYPPEFDRLMAAGGEAKTYFDRFIHCSNPRT